MYIDIYIYIYIYTADITLPALNIGFRVEAEGHLSVTVCELVYETQMGSAQAGVVYTGSQSHFPHCITCKQVVVSAFQKKEM